MEIQFVLNDKQVKAEVGADTILLNVLRDLGCKSVKCGCETTNCGLCTVWINGKSRLYYLFFIRDGKKTLLLIEPSQEMVNMMAQYSKVLEK